jgi:quinol monooxygenase YgiN
VSTTESFAHSTLVCEVAELAIVPDQVENFTLAAEKAIDVILDRDTAHGAHLLASIEKPDHFLLLVVWNTVESHEEFRASDDFPHYRAHIQEYFAALPQVLHYTWKVGRGLPIA